MKEPSTYAEMEVSTRRFDLPRGAAAEIPLSGIRIPRARVLGLTKGKAREFLRLHSGVPLEQSLVVVHDHVVESGVLQLYSCTTPEYIAHQLLQLYSSSRISLDPGSAERSPQSPPRAQRPRPRDGQRATPTARQRARQASRATRPDRTRTADVRY